MKKHLYFAFAAAAMLCACSSSDDVVDAGGIDVPGVDDNSRQEILLSVGANAQVATRGTGSVGANHNDLSTNEWQNQTVNIYMFDKGTFDVATDDAGAAIYQNAPFLTPTGTNSGVAYHMDSDDASYDYSTEGYKRSYYPVNGSFDFWGYRVDDASNVDVSVDGTVKFTIDGSQDVLAASTVLSQEDSLKLARALKSDGSVMSLTDAVTAGIVIKKDDGDYIKAFVDVTDGIAAKTNFESYRDSLYSARTARRDVQPNLLFKHKLTRFTFDAKAMQDKFAKGGTDEIRIREINVYSKVNGQLVASYTSDGAIVTTLSSSDNDASTPLSLKKRSTATGTTQNSALVNLIDEITPDDNTVYELAVEEGTTTERAAEGIALALFDPSATGDDANKGVDANSYNEIGEALMVIPGEEEYAMEIVLEQTAYSREYGEDGTDASGNNYKAGDGVPGSKKIYVKPIKGLTIKYSDVKANTNTPKVDENVTAFEEGKSYNVKVQVYGMSKIEITTTLEPWIDGGYIEIDPDVPVTPNTGN